MLVLWGTIEFNVGVSERSDLQAVTKGRIRLTRLAPEHRHLRALLGSSFERIRA